MKDKSFPRWCAPLFGTFAGIFCGGKAGVNSPIPIAYWLFGGAIIGALAGCVVFLLDPAPPEEIPDGIPEHLFRKRRQVENPSAVIGRFLAITGILLCWIPVMGLIVNVAGWILNRKTGDWAKPCSIVGASIGFLITAFVMAVLLVEQING